jgi:DnaJ-class molecular chaperone
MDTSTALEILSLGDSANTLRMSKLKARWQQVATENHPDRGGDPTEFAKMREAYQFLKTYINEHSDCWMCDGTGKIGIYECVNCHGTGKRL